MFRRPLVVRRSPGLIGTVARTAAITGAAMVTSHAIAGHYQHQQAAAQADLNAQASSTEIADLQDQVATLQANQAQHAMTQASVSSPDEANGIAGQLTQLAQLRDAGVLTTEQFEEAKNRVLSQ